MSEVNGTESVLKWADPPPNGAGRPVSPRWAGVAKALRERPGQWALIAEDATPIVASRIRNGDLAAFRPAAAFEAKSRAGGDSRPGRADIYARFVGEVAS